jgi:transcriptional regulator with XRE-family HTH domain
MDARRIVSVRKRLDLSQELMARILDVSFASVNRWEGGHSSPMGATRDLYLALDAALREGYSAAAIRRAANAERGPFLYALFRMAYAHRRSAQ